MPRFVLPVVTSLALSCTLAATPALADRRGDRVTVRTADLDLATAAGARTLRTRIDRAVASLCGDVDQRDLRAMAWRDRCRATAMADAMPQMQVALAAAQGGRAYAANSAGARRAGS